MPPKQFTLKPRDVAWILDCYPDDVTELARKGKLKAFRQGKFWRFSPADVEAYKRKNKEQS